MPPRWHRERVESVGTMSKPGRVVDLGRGARTRFRRRELRGPQKDGADGTGVTGAFQAGAAVTAKDDPEGRRAVRAS
jgi:hypothetical protein